MRENPPVSIPPSRPAPVGAQGKPTLKDPQEIEDFLLYRLFRITHVGLRGTDDMYKRELGISRREWRILAYLARTPDASLKALAADAGIDVVVASRTVADMHSRGLVDKRRSPGNKRLVCLRLTDDGVQIHGKANHLLRTVGAGMYTLDGVAADALLVVDQVRTDLLVQR